MEADEKLALLEQSLEQAADALGDITGPVMALYYQRWPDALAHFDASGERDKLEGAMVAQALYCLTRWHAAPREVEIILLNAVPHHIDMLQVGPCLFSELIRAVCDVIAGALPPDAEQARQVWSELGATMDALVAEKARHARMARLMPVA